VGAPGPDPENADHWDDLDAGTLHIPGSGQRPDMAIRVAPKEALMDNDAKAEFVAAFGRPAIQSPKRQKFASPFVGPEAWAKMMFYEKPTARQAAGTTGWTIKLGQVKREGPGANKTHRYEFAVGINVTSGDKIRSFGEDPEFDVGG